MNENAWSTSFCWMASASEYTNGASNSSDCGRSSRHPSTDNISSVVRRAGNVIIAAMTRCLRAKAGVGDLMAARS
jgi:hypothetical protein